MKIEVPSGATPLDSDALQMLIPNLTTQRELNEFEAQNISDAVVWAQKSRKLKKEILSASGLMSLHRKMFDQTWTWAGKFRWRQTNIGVAPDKIQNELGALLGNVQHWIENKTYTIEISSIRFHHKLVWIHPFPNGNGRFSRLAADLLVEFNEGRKLSWGSKDLTKESENRNQYLNALRAADQNNYELLIAFAAGGSK